MDTGDRIRPGPIVRDVIIIFVLTFFGGCMVGASSALKDRDSTQSMLLVGIANFVLGTIGFTLSGVMAPRGNRWLHLLWVALGAWLTGLVNVVTGLPLIQWAAGIVVVLAMMALGGVASMGFKPDKSRS